MRTRKSKIDQENSNDENAEESEKTSPVKVKKRRKKKREKKARKILESSDEEEEPVPEPFQNLDSDTTSQSSNNPYNNMSKLTSTNYHNATTSTPAQVLSHDQKHLKSDFRSFPRRLIVYQASVQNLSELQLLQKDAEYTIKVLATSASIMTSTRILKVK